MATPEQNTLLALQLFRQPAEDFAANNNARVSLAYRIAAAQREEQLKRELAQMQLAREDLRIQGANTRQDAMIRASNQREDTKEKSALDRLKSQQGDRDRADIENEFDKLYPQYAAAAARAGGEVKQRTDYPATRAGVGQLAADLQGAAVGYEQRQKKSAADAALSELSDKQAQLAEARNHLAELAKPHPDDEKIARPRAVAQVKAALEQGQLASAAKLSKKAQTDGLAALSRGDTEVARRLLGDEAIDTYDAAYEQTLFQMPNTKARLQERTIASQGLMALQREAAGVESDLRKASATNPYLAEKLPEYRTNLQKLMAPVDTGTKQRRSLDQIFGPNAGAVVPNPSAAATPSPVRLLTGDDPLIAAENQRRQQAMADQQTRGMATEQQSRSDTYNGTVDQLAALQSLIGGVRSGSPAAVAQATNPMGGYIPGRVDPSLQASGLSTLLQQAERMRAEQEAARRQMLWLPGTDPIINPAPTR